MQAGMPAVTNTTQAVEALHALPAYARDLLKAAALLHDIGWSVPGKPHHKASRDIILKDTKMNLSSVERKIIAMIVRYHRRSTPRSDHAIYYELDDLKRPLFYGAQAYSVLQMHLTGHTRNW